MNHLGHFLLTILLLPQMSRTSSSARIINVTSDVHNPKAKTGMPDPGLHWPQDPRSLAIPGGGPAAAAVESKWHAGCRRYCESKLANVMFSYALARRLQSIPEYSGISVSAFNPGALLGTGLGRSKGKWTIFSLRLLAPLLRFHPYARRTETSGEELAELAVGDRVQPPPAAAAAAANAAANGCYYDGLSPAKSSDLSYVLTHQEALWSASEDLVGLTAEEKGLLGNYRFVIPPEPLT